MIYHLTTPLLWQEAQQQGEYRIDSLQKEGFIHLCTEAQLQGVYERYYSSQPALAVLKVNPEKLKPELKYEHSPSVGESFPHCFGPINLNAVEEVIPFRENLFSP